MVNKVDQKKRNGKYGRTEKGVADGREVEGKRNEGQGTVEEIKKGGQEKIEGSGMRAGNGRKRETGGNKKRGNSGF